MMIQWMFAPAGGAGRDDSSDGLTSTTSEHSSLDGAHGSAFHDLLPSVLALLDFESIRQLSGTCRVAVRSSVRAHVLERSVVQLSPSSLAVHEMLRRMPLRSHLRSMEIRDCLTPPRAVGDLPTLLASVVRVKFADEPKLDREVLDEASRIGRESGVARKMGRTEYVRHVRRRLNEEHRTMYPREFAEGSPQVASELAPWFSALNPALLVDIDFGKMRIDNFGWLRRFPSLKKLQFNASSDFPSDDYLKPLMSAASLEELVITRLMVRDCKELAALGSLRKLELRGAPKIRSVDFLRSLGKLECLVLTEMIVSDLSPLLHLTALRDLTLDSIAFTSADLFRDGASHPVPALPHLKSIQIVFTGMVMDRLLCHAPRLKQLHLCDSRLESWRPLQALSRLEQISISIDGIDDWSALAGLPRLTRLALDSRHGLVTSRHFGTGWSALEEVISPPWDDYTRLVEGARRLRRLQLLGWRSRDSSSLSVLKSATNLRTLWIAFLPGPVELSTVGELHQLRSLELWNASVVTIEFLRGLENLVELKLASPFRAGVEIISFAPLGQLKQLQTLALSGRREFKNVNLEVFARLPKLKNVDVSNSGVTPSYQRKLQARYNTQAFKSSTRSPLAPAMR